MVLFRLLTKHTFISVIKSYFLVTTLTEQINRPVTVAVNISTQLATRWAIQCQPFLIRHIHQLSSSNVPETDVCCFALLYIMLDFYNPAENTYFVERFPIEHHHVILGIIGSED